MAPCLRHCPVGRHGWCHPLLGDRRHQLAGWLSSAGKSSSRAAWLSGGVSSRLPDFRYHAGVPECSTDLRPVHRRHRERRQLHRWTRRPGLRHDRNRCRISFFICCYVIHASWGLLLRDNRRHSCVIALVGYARGFCGSTSPSSIMMGGGEPWALTYRLRRPCHRQNRPVTVGSAGNRPQPLRSACRWPLSSNTCRDLVVTFRATDEPWKESIHRWPPALRGRLLVASTPTAASVAI